MKISRHATTGKLHEILYRIYAPLINHPGRERSINVLHDRRVAFIHNPKCAGTSIKETLGITIETADHRIPSHILHPKTWERYLTFVVVRNPFERLVSSYSFHTSFRYQGLYLQKYPGIKQLSFEEYFRLMKKEPYAIRQQVDYLRHCRSDMPIDYICHAETLLDDLSPVFEHMGIGNALHHLNPSTHKPYREYFQNASFQREVEEFYEKDLEAFRYTFS